MKWLREFTLEFSESTREQKPSPVPSWYCSTHLTIRTWNRHFFMAEKSFRALSINNRNNPFGYPNYKLWFGLLLQQYSCARSQCFWHCHTQTLVITSSLQPTSISFDVFLQQKNESKGGEQHLATQRFGCFEFGCSVQPWQFCNKHGKCFGMTGRT